MVGGRDELGILPPDIAAMLTPASSSGARNAQMGTIELATAVLVLVPVKSAFARETGMASIVRAARNRGLPYEIADPTTTTDSLLEWLPAAEPTRLMITGPRGTRWPEGDRAAWQLVTRLIMATSPDRDVIIPRSRMTTD